jgi:hypothetical protein
MVGETQLEHPYKDHWSSTYSPAEVATLTHVLAFNRELVAAFENGRDVRTVTRRLDPDPMRYVWVDEGDGEIDPDLEEASRLLAEAPVIAGHQRLVSHAVDDVGNASVPSVAIGPEGSMLLTWIDWVSGSGEQVKVVLLDRAGTPVGPPEVVSSEPADCFRPSAAFDSEGKPWVFYGISRGQGAEVRAHKFDSNRWSDPMTVSTGRPAFNQEVAPLRDGGLVCCWQQWVGGRYAILARTHVSGRWGDPVVISGDSDGNVWDPSVAISPDGRLNYAWCSYREGSYRIVSRREHKGVLAPERSVSAGTDYGMHPSLACTPSGEVWCAFDRITVQAHGGSGTTRLRATREVSDSRPVDGTVPPGRHFPGELMADIKAAVELVRIDEEQLLSVPGVGQGLDIAPAGMPRLAATSDGGLVLAFRVVRRLPLITYYWEVAVQTLGREGLSDPMTFSDSDGTAEEPDIAGGIDGAMVVWQHDGRREKALTWTEGFGGRECLHLKEHYGNVVWHAVHDKGDISWGFVKSGGVASAPKANASEILWSSERREARPWLASRPNRYHTSLADAAYNLYWGDLHRHSLISRCTVADEPTLDDYYRYSRDIFGYDFWALTDHAENTSARQWWCVQKAADLLCVDQEFAPLYGFEWTSWSGHQNVIFGPCRRGAPIISALAEGSDKPDKLWALLNAHPDFPAITIPHHPGSAMTPFDWNYYDPHYVRLAEIFQACRGNYEDDGCFRQFADATSPGTFIVDGLKRNYRFGLIASTDHGFGASYVGLYANTLDRASVFESLHARRTLAATARDIVIDFRIGNTFMGGETFLSGPAQLDVYAKGYREIARLEIVRNGETVHRVDQAIALPPAWLKADLRIEWGMASVTTDWSGSARVENGEFAQPEFWAPEVTAVAKSRIEWRTVVPNLGGHAMYGSARRGGVEVTVIGPPDAVVVVTTAPASVRARLSDLASNRAVEVKGDDGRRLRLQPGTGALTGMGCSEKRISWVDQPDASAWYYVRAILTDGELAWSSPIWVDRG